MALVLIVEDDSQVRVLAEDILQHAGHESKSAANATEAKALLNTDHPFDVLFTDVNLDEEGLNGFHIAQEAVQLRKGIKVIYTTGADITDGTRELQVEGSVLIPKPYTSADVMAAIDGLLSTSSGTHSDSAPT